MRRIIVSSAAAVVALLASLFPTWHFSESLGIPASPNPLWTEDGRQIASPLTKELKEQGYVFGADRGAEADPDGICFGHFGRDEYWVIQYHAETKPVIAYAYILNYNWIGHLSASSKFSKLKHTLKKHLK